MNKNILTAAIGAALIAGPLAAQADVTISGRVGGALTSFSSDAVDIGLAMNDFGHSRIQIDGTSGDFFARVADDVRANKLTKGLGDRDMYLGYKMGDMKFMLGRMANAGKNIEGDPYIANFLEVRSSYMGLGSSLNSNGFRDGMVSASGKAGDISWTVAINPNSDTAQALIGDGIGNSGEVQLAVKGKFGGVNAYLSYVSAASEAITLPGATTSITAVDITLMKIGASMKFGDIKANLDLGTWDVAGNAYQTVVVGANMGLGDGLAADVQIGSGSADGGFTSTWLRLAVMKKMGKSNVFAGFTSGDTSLAGTAYSAVGLGATVKF